jgi:hypothetical protein
LILLYENASPNDYIICDEGFSLQLYTQATEFVYKYSQFRLGANNLSVDSMEACGLLEELNYKWLCH